jgi:Fe-S oxidoreductase
MSPAVVLSLLIVASLALAVAGALWRVTLWRRGQPAKVDFIRGLAAIPKRYFRDVHEVVARDRYAARLHVLTAGGFGAALLLMLLVYLLGVPPWWLTELVIVTLAAMLIGTLLVLWRRRFNRPPPRLSTGKFTRLPLSLAAFALGSLLFVVPAAAQPGWSWISVVALALALWGWLEIAAATWGGPLKHAFAGALHLAFHPRPQRFAGQLSTALQPLDLDVDQYGVKTPSDFAWNRLLGFDACVQCGRCESACPAFAAGQPLNPKKLIQDLVTGMRAGSDEGYRGSPHPGLAIGQAHGAPQHAITPNLIHPDTLWACTTCRACVYECPMFIEHVDAIIDLRRFLTMEKGATPGKGPQVLEQLQATDNPNGHDPNSRLDWAADLALPLMRDVAETDVLLWLGDGAFELRNQRTLRALVKLLRYAEVDFAVLGTEELDCGDIARRLGDEASFQALAKRNSETLQKYRFQRIVTADPHVFHSLKNEYPALGFFFITLHHTALLAELLASGKLRIRKPLGTSTTLTYHDPCYLGRYNGELQAPRGVLRALGGELREMQRSGLRSRCCGGGGGAPLTDIPGKRRIPDLRMDDARASGAEVVAVACPNCCLMLEGVVQPRPAVKDIAELLLEAVEG